MSRVRSDYCDCRDPRECKESCFFAAQNPFKAQQQRVRNQRLNQMVQEAYERTPYAIGERVGAMERAMRRVAVLIDELDEQRDGYTLDGEEIGDLLMVVPALLEDSAFLGKLRRMFKL